LTNALHPGGTSQQGKQVTLFGDIVEKVCCHPAYRLLSLRALPQMPPASLDFTTFTWPAILRRLRQMQITGAHLPAVHAHLLQSSCCCCCCCCTATAVLCCCGSIQLGIIGWVLIALWILGVVMMATMFMMVLD